MFVVWPEEVCSVREVRLSVRFLFACLSKMLEALGEQRWLQSAIRADLYSIVAVAL